MHSRETLEAYLEKLDKKLFAIYAIAKSELMGTFQERWCSHWPEGNDHGPGHIDRVLDNLAVLVGHEPVQVGELSRLDLFLAMMGVVAHDIGVIKGRDHHARESAKLIGKIAASNQYVFDDHLLEILSAAIICHTSSVVIEDECSRLMHEEPIAGQTVRPYKVAALVRLADELDEDYRRAPKQLLDLGLIPQKSGPYWHFCQCIQGVKIDPPGGDILINARFNEDVLQGKYDPPEQTFLQFFAEKLAKINVERVRVASFLGGLARKRLGVRVSLPRELRPEFVARTFYFEDDMGRNPSKAEQAARRFLESYPDLVSSAKRSTTTALNPRIDENAILPKRLPEPQYPDEATRQATKDYQNALERVERLCAEGVSGSALEAAKLDAAKAKRVLREGLQLREGEILDDRYLILERLGRGGFATVWRAKDTISNTVTAIKVLHGHCTQDRSQRDRFRIGIREMSRLEHPNIVRVLDSYHVDGGIALPDGDRNGGNHYFVMEYLDGGDLGQAVKREALSADSVWKCVEAIASALEYAHSKGTIHRDVKPENILLAADGTAKLTDFDLARAADSSHGTKTGALGSVFYAAPEVHKSGVVIDERADIYSLAMTIVFALRRQEWTLEDFLDRKRVVNALGNRNLSAILMKALAVKPEQRYSSMREFWNALHAAITPQNRKRAPAAPRQRSGEGHLADLLLQAHRAAPKYKPACILAVLEALEDGEVSVGRLDPKVIFRRFDKILEEASGSGWQPFFHLSTDGFWEFVKDGRKVDRTEFEKRRPNTRKQLLEKIDFAAIPATHEAWWSDPTELSALRRAVLEMLELATPGSTESSTGEGLTPAGTT